jgi:hypothetical protein
MVVGGVLALLDVTTKKTSFSTGNQKITKIELLVSYLKVSDRFISKVMNYFFICFYRVNCNRISLAVI